jgi:hypothetical protein
MKCVACRGDEPPATDAEIATYQPFIPEWKIVERHNIKRLECAFKFKNLLSRRVHKQGCGNRGARGTSSHDSDRMGQSHRNLVDAQNQGLASQRFHHGGEN